MHKNFGQSTVFKSYNPVVMLSKAASHFSQLFKDLATPLKKEKSKTGFIEQIIVEIKKTRELELSLETMGDYIYTGQLQKREM